STWTLHPPRTGGKMGAVTIGPVSGVRLLRIPKFVAAPKSVRFRRVVEVAQYRTYVSRPVEVDTVQPNGFDSAVTCLLTVTETSPTLLNVNGVAVVVDVLTSTAPKA